MQRSKLVWCEDVHILYGLLIVMLNELKAKYNQNNFIPSQRKQLIKAISFKILIVDLDSAENLLASILGVRFSNARSNATICNAHTITWSLYLLINPFKNCEIFKEKTLTFSHASQLNW